MRVAASCHALTMLGEEWGQGLDDLVGPIIDATFGRSLRGHPGDYGSDNHSVKRNG
jgi:hypothetical protein